MTILKQINKKFIAFFLVAIFILTPALSLGGKTNRLYVDDDASGTQDGSKNHPYKTISRALDHADKNTKVKVSKGTYKENIEIPKGVEVIGTDWEKVIIKADNDGKATVKMNDDTKLIDVTVRGGEEGIKVKKGDQATIYHCIIKDNDETGIYIEEGDKSKKEEVTITKSKIKDNGRSGIFTDGRKLVIEDNEIENNKSDGIDLGSKSRAWLANNQISYNGGSGLKIELDNAEVYTKRNTISHNKREGAEINLKWKSGKIVFKKDKFKDNGNYAIARVQRNPVSTSLWNGVVVENSVSFLESIKGSISHIFRIY